MLRIESPTTGRSRILFWAAGSMFAGIVVFAAVGSGGAGAQNLPFQFTLRGSQGQDKVVPLNTLRGTDKTVTGAVASRGKLDSQKSEHLRGPLSQPSSTPQSQVSFGAHGRLNEPDVQGLPGVRSEPVADTYQAPDADLYVATDYVETKETSFLDDVGSTLLYLRDNIVPVLLFRGSSDAVGDRNVTYTMPQTGPLRHSMMHAANVYEGLRSQQASVGDTVSTALRGSYISRARLERANADRARVHGAVAAFLPSVEANLSGSINGVGGTSSSNTNSSGEIISAGVEVSVPIYSSGTNRHALTSAKHTARASAYTYLAEEHRVALEAVTAHVNLRLQRRVESILSRNVNDMQKVASIARRLFEAGDSSRTDIAIADANVQSARSELDLARRSREETQADYESTTGQYAPKKLAAASLNGLLPNSLEAAVELGLRHNPTLAAAHHTAAATKFSAKAERGRYGPQVNAFGNYNRDLHRSTPSSSDTDWSVGVRLRVPLFNAASAPNVNAARHEALESGYRALDQARIVEREIERQWTAYQSARRRVAIVSRQVKAIRQGLIGAQREFKAGFRAVTDVLDEQVNLARAQITLENVMHEQMLAAHELAFTIASPKLKQLAVAR